jgi:AraC-like DNA-binding protein
MSRARHDETHPVRWFGLTFGGGVLQPPVAPGWRRLVATRSGACLARAAGLVAAVTPATGLFIDDGVSVELFAREQVQLRMLYLRRSWCGRPDAAARAVAVTPLLRALVERAVDRGVAFDAREPRERHLIDVVLDEVDALAGAPFGLAFPSDRRALRAAECCLAAPDVPQPAQRLAAVAGTSARTLERLFSAETGLSVGRWQRRLRLLAAGRALAASASVTDIAYDAGYGSPSAFIAAFRRAFGTTPGAMRIAASRTTP